MKYIIPEQEFCYLQHCYEVVITNNAVAEVSRVNTKIYLNKGNKTNITNNIDIVYEKISKEDKN